ncbi:MAG: hypothetical protein V3V03_00595 [Hyphomonadaceae bacterium]
MARGQIVHPHPEPVEGSTSEANLSEKVTPDARSADPGSCGNLSLPVNKIPDKACRPSGMTRVA